MNSKQKKTLFINPQSSEVEAIHKMKLDIDELYAFINNSQYTIIKTSDFRPFVNFIDIMYVFGTQLDIETKDEFIIK